MKQKEKELIIMTQKELLRYDVIKKLIEQKVNGTEASIQMNLSIRQTKRLKARVKKYGAKGIIHCNRNKKLKLELLKR